MENSQCASCATPTPSGATFCPKCGSRAGTPTGPLLSAEAERAFRAAAGSAKAAVANLGIDKTLAIVGGLLGIVGITVLPFYSAAFSVPGLDLGGAMSFIHLGISADLILTLAILLAIAPLILNLSRSLALTGFSLGSAALGALILGFLGMPYGSFVAYGSGFYCTIIGFILLAYVYGSRTQA